MADYEIDARQVQALTGEFPAWARSRDKAFAQAVQRVAAEALTLAQQQYVPVRTGRLRDSGRVDRAPVAHGAGVWWIEASFNTPYALQVNELPGRRNPARPLAGPRYLERAVIARLASVDARVAADTMAGAATPTRRGRA